MNQTKIFLQSGLMLFLFLFAALGFDFFVLWSSLGFVIHLGFTPFIIAIYIVSTSLKFKPGISITLQKTIFSLDRNSLFACVCKTKLTDPKEWTRYPAQGPISLRDPNFTAHLRMTHLKP
jgi:hypothetical protein